MISCGRPLHAKIAILIFSLAVLIWQIPRAFSQPIEEKEPDRKWTDRISIRGYAQFRYNRLLETNPNLKCEQCDTSWGDQNTFLIRRARLIFSGDETNQIYFYIQPDLASSSDGKLHFLQLRDLYFDLALDIDREFRFRIGQSKIPYGWENMQSSSNRIAFDRTDAMNSALPNERDLGVIFYWAPPEIRKRFRELIDSGLKGSGDYGVLALGTYVGQGANQAEANNNLHTVARVTYPFKLSNGQFFEPGIQAYAGLYSIPMDDSSKRGVGVLGDTLFPDQRIGLSFVYYPQPLGFQAEGNIGRGPQYNPSSNTIETHSLVGGYVQSMFELKFQKHTLIPYVRAQYYKGGKKQEFDARSYLTREYEIGIEWLPIPAFELTAAYTISDRTFEDSENPSNRQQGNLLRLQFQFNY